MYIFISVLLFIIATVFFAISISLYRSNYNLVHSYHHKNVRKELKREYSKKISLGMFIISCSLYLTVFLNLCNIDYFSYSLLIGLIIGFYYMYKVQKKYNGGIF